MSLAPLPTGESERLAVLRALGVLDTAPETPFDGIAAIARSALWTEASIVGFLDEHRHWFKARQGVDFCESPRSTSFCAHAIAQDDPLWVADAREDPRFRDNPLVASGLRVRFYAGAPIVMEGRHPVGTVCVLGLEPRPYDPALASILVELARMAADQLELRHSRSRVELARRESEAARDTMSLLVRSATTPLVMTDRDLRVVDVSDRWVEHYALAREAVLGRTMHQVFPAGRDRWDPVYRRCLAGERERGQASSTVPGRDGKRWFQWEISPWRDAGGEVAGLLLSNHDVSDLVHAKEEAERDQRRLLMAVDIADLVIWHATFHDRQLHVVGSPEALFGFPLRFEDLTDPKHTIVHPDDRAMVDIAWKRHLAGEGPFRVEHRTNRPDCDTLWVSSTLELLRDAEGKPVGTIGVLTDITRRKTWEMDIRAAHRAAEAANRAKDEFLANMSHEVRTPLNGVLGVAGALALSGLDPVQTEMVRTIEGSGRELERMLTGVLELVRLGEGGVESLNEPVDLVRVLEETHAAGRAQARAKGLDLQVVRMGEGPAVALGDETRIRDILGRLLDNALKFTEAGSVRLGLELRPADGGVRACFTVEDTGVGFDPTQAERLFDRFQQADGSSTRRFGGSGLGLAVCRALAVGMGGTLDARSEPGRGSVFTLALNLQVPAVRDAA